MGRLKGRTECGKRVKGGGGRGGGGTDIEVIHMSGSKINTGGESDC